MIVKKKGILEEIINKNVEEVNLEEEKEKEQNEREEKEDEKEKEKENQQPVPIATNDEAGVVSKGEQEDAGSEGENSKEEECEEPDKDTFSDEEVRMPTKKEPLYKEKVLGLLQKGSVLWLV
ncbi:uncharacterized protein LOC130796756 [Amaranthus tricolor]|uniref:uncharacterized protein LOC130796756 n=1 Tax=Amaranthus tricolor TaxID=29722 RepID=UPI0025853952|nr:uncharacterized protein LOC130796756 [Amaranthus tricolor]